MCIRDSEQIVSERQRIRAELDREVPGASAADLALRPIRFLGDGSGETCSGVKSGGVSDMEKKIGLQQQASPERQRR